MKNTEFFCLIILLSLLWFGCIGTESKNGSSNNNQNTEYIPPDKSITADNAFNNLFFDSAKLQGFLDKHSEYAVYQEQFFNFYKQRNYEYAWFDTSGVTEQASDFMNLLNTTIIEGHDSDL